MILMNCNDAGLATILAVVKNMLNIIWIVGPIVSIIALIIGITKLVTTPDDKKIPKTIFNSLIALVVLFLIPALVNGVMYMLGESSSVSSCWNRSSTISFSSSYINPYGSDRRRGFVHNPSEYEKGDEKKTDNSGTYTNDADYAITDTSCGSLEYCNKFLTSMVNNSRRLNDAIIKNNAPVTYSWPKSAKSWGAAIRIAERGGLVATTCVVPANWGVTDVVGSHSPLNSVGLGGFHNYKGKITQYTKQYKFDGSMSVKTAIQRGMIQPGDIVGVKGHTFAIYSVNKSTGSAVVFDGGHRFTVPCQKKRQCSPMFTYSAKANASMRLYQLIRWVK